MARILTVGGKAFSVALALLSLLGHLHSQTTFRNPAAGATVVKQRACKSVASQNGREEKDFLRCLDPEPRATMSPLDKSSSIRDMRVDPPVAALFVQNPQDMRAPQNPRSGKDEGQSASSTSNGSPGHIFWVVPAFKVDYAGNFEPLTVKEKFAEWAHGSYDPLGLGAGAAEAATLEHSSQDGFCGYGRGWSGYGKCFGSLELDANVSSFIGDFALTALLHQDPRYFRLGKGSSGKRIFYAISRVFLTYNDSGHTVFYSSALAGTTAAAAISNLYYPQQDRTLGHTVSRIAIDLGNTALYNTAAEFWLDIHRKLQRIF